MLLFFSSISFSSLLSKIVFSFPPPRHVYALRTEARGKARTIVILVITSMHILFMHGLFHA